ncbi:MAG: hypothetical protein CMP65_01095 [Flavobacteriales bacterium]|nr:hypothetical protein [Flavobacteriales bacterium]|tara:strand:+ start:12754 stop:13569 length:816 start_codon:yes stop_codon:yes gene_type:complete
MNTKFILILLFIVCSLKSQEYIQINRPDINIRMLPTTSSPIVGHAFNNEIYIINGENDKWFSVTLPSGESRWIYKRLAKRVPFNNDDFSAPNIAEVQKEISIAEYKALKNTNNESIEDLNKDQINKLLFDRYVLIVLQKYNIQPASFNRINSEEYNSKSILSQPISEYLVSVTHVDYDLFKIDFANFYIQTKRCFKLGKALDAMIYIYKEDDQIFQRLCFEQSYGKGFENCYTIKNIFESVLEEPNLTALTNDGKIKKTDLILRETILDLD